MRTSLNYLFIFLLGGLAGALPFLFFVTPDTDNAPSFDPYTATTDQADLASVGDESDEHQRIVPTAGQSCEETLALVQNAHARAIDELSTRQDRIDELSELVDRTSTTTPMNFPAELDDAFRPEQIQQTVEQLKDECPDLFPPETTTDCSEYPCAIEFPLDFEGNPQEAWRYDYNEACPALATHFGHGRRHAMASSFEGETRIQYMVHGTGIGLDQHLEDRQGKLQHRIQQRWQNQRREMARELYEDTCLTELDPNACREVANAYWGDREERELYLQIGCEADDASACNGYAWERCYGAGNCDATSEQIARRAVELAPENGNIIHTLGVVLCQRGQSAEAARTWHSACQMGHDLSCTEICS